MATFLVPIQAYTQWDSYDATWEGKPGTMNVNMDADAVPYKDKLLYLAEIIIDPEECDSRGYPVNDEYRLIEKELRVLDSMISEVQYGLTVGRFLYQCTLKEYVYLDDTAFTRDVVNQHLTRDYKLRLLTDSEWEIYQKFIYPDPYLIQTMANRQIIDILQNEGYDLMEKQSLTHFASFASDADRNRYRQFLIEQNFKILSQKTVDEEARGYLIRFSRNDRLQLDKLSNITLRLDQRSIALNGKYEGWEIVVVDE